MAKPVKAFEREASSGGDSHPWSEWLDGRVWELTKGKDFTVHASMRARIYEKAKRMGGKVRVRSYEQGKRIQLQFVKQ